MKHAVFGISLTSLIVVFRPTYCKYTRATVRLITQHTVKYYLLYSNNYLPGHEKFQPQVSGFCDVYILYNWNLCPLQQIFFRRKGLF